MNDKSYSLLMIKLVHKIGKFITVISIAAGCTHPEKLLITKIFRYLMDIQTGHNKILMALDVIKENQIIKLHLKHGRE